MSPLLPSQISASVSNDTDRCFARRRATTEPKINKSVVAELLHPPERKKKKNLLDGVELVVVPTLPNLW